MKKTVIRFLSLLLTSWILFSSFSFSSFGKSVPCPSKEEASAVLLYHMETDSYLDGKEENSILPAGSTVKLLSGYLFCELSKGNRDRIVTVEKSMVNGITGHRAGLSIGTQLTVNDLLILSLCGSYNDAFSVLACYFAESLSGFALLMNQKAFEIGCKHSNFTSPIGIDDGSTTTASDLLKIAKIAYQNDDYMQLTSLQQYSLSLMDVKNHNELIYTTTTNAFRNALCRGMTAGNTSRAGSCVITAFTNQNQHFISIVLGGITTNDVSVDYGYLITNDMIQWCCNSFSLKEVIPSGMNVGSIPVTVSDVKDEISLCTKNSLTSFLPDSVDIKQDLSFRIRLDYDSLEAPVEEGFSVGVLAVIYQGKVLGTVPLYTAESVERSMIGGFLQNIKTLTDYRPVRAGGIFFLTAFVLWIVIGLTYKRKKRKKWETYFDEKQN